MQFLCILPLIFLAGEGNNEAKVLFDAAEKTLLEAKTIEISMQGKTEHGSIEGKLVFATHNRMRSKLCWKIAPAWTMTSWIASDGIDLRWDGIIVIEESGSLKELEYYSCPEEFNAQHIRAFHRSGLANSVTANMTCLGDQEPTFKVSDLAMVGKEMVGDRLTQVIRYYVRIKWGKESSKVSVRLWIDNATGLPIKRELTSEDKAETTENYEIRLNTRLNPRHFPVVLDKQQ